MTVLKGLAFLLIIAGFAIVMAAKSIVVKYDMQQKTKCDFSGEMTEEELMKYKFDKAVIHVKMMGMVVFFPGIALVLILFR